MSDEIANAVLDSRARRASETASETASERVLRLEAEQAEEQQTLGALQAQKARGVRLGRDAYVTMLMLVDSIEIREKELAQAQAAAVRELAHQAMHEAQREHDSRVEQVYAAASAIVASIASLHEAIARFETIYDVQHAGLMAMVQPDG